MDEEERDKKLRAGKEKLAAFQKKKSKKKPGHHHDRAATSSEHSTEMAHSSSLTSSSDMSLFEDSDQNQMSEDEMNTQDSKTLFKTQAKLKQATERIAELEESLEGKQLALDRVLSENAKLNGSSNHEKVTELETALLKRDEIIRQLTIKLQTAASLESDAAQLGQHVQQLQAQLINAGKLMESQNHKQIASSQALMEAKNEIGALQKCIEDKDNLLSQLSEKVHAISIEYSSLKASYEVSKQKEEESSKVVKSLMSDAEEFRKQGNVNGSMATSHSDLESKVQEVRLEMEETYGKQIALMKEELVNHYQTQIDSVTFELNTVKDHYTRLEYQQQSLEEEKLSLSSMNESLSKSLSELEANLTEVNSKLTETQVQRDEIFKLNSALNEQMEAVQAQNLYLENEKPKQKEETTSVYTENDVDMGSENNELLDKNLMLCNELEQLKNDYSDAKTLIDDLQKKAKGGRSTRFQVDSQEIVMELKQVTEQYEEALVNIALMQGKIEDYDIKCEDLSDDLQKLKERYAESDETVKNYEERVHNYEQKENSLMLELKALTDKCQKAETLNEEYRDKFVEYERQLTDYEGLTTQFNELQHECNMYQTQNDELNNKMNIQQDVLMELRAELEILTNQNQAYQEQSLFHVSQIEGLTQDNKSMQEMLARQTDEVKNLTSNLSSVSTQVDVYKDKTTSLESTIENLQKQLQDKDVVEVESKQKDMYIAELNSKINDLTASLKDLESDSSQIQKETVVVEETCVQKTSSLNQTPLQINDSLSALENQIVTIESDEIENLNLEKSDDFYQSVQTHDISSQSNNMLHCDQNIEAGLIGTNSNQSEQTLHLNADVDVTDIDADSLDGDESTQSFDSIDESNLSRNKLVTQVKELKYQNQILASDNNKLAVENTTLKSSIEKLNNELNEMSYTKSDLNQSTQTLKAENSDVTISCEMSHQGGMSQNNEVVDGLSQSKLESDESRTLTESFMVSQASLSRICFGCEQLKSEKLSIEEIHRNEIIEKQEEIDNLRHELESFETPKNGMNSVKENLEHLNQSHNDENEMLRSENEKLKQTLTVSNEREQNLQSQNERLTQQVYNLSVLHQTVSGDKENLENRFVEVAGMDNTENFVSEFINDNENGLHRETVVEKTNACPSEALSETNIDEIKSDEKLTKSEFSPEDDIDSKVLKCVSGSSVETIATPTDHQPTKPSRELSTTLEALKKQYESQLDSLRQELDTERQARTENMDDTQNKEEKLEMLDTAEKETVDEVITAINTQHAMEIEQLQQKYLDDVDLKVKAMRITLEQIYTSQLDLVQTELEKKRVQSLKELHDQLTQEHEGDINRIEMLWEKRLEDLEDQHDNEMNKSLLEESLNTKESTSVQIQRALKKMAQEHEGILQKISDGLEKSPKLRTPRKKKQNQEQQTEGDETDTESIRSMPVTEEEYQQLEEKEKIVEKAEDVRRTLENQREELDQLRACLLQEYEQLLSARTQSMSVEAQEVEKLEDEMNQLHRLYKQKAKEQPGHQASDLSNLKAQYENKISTLEKYHQEELLKFRDEVEKLRQDLSSQKRESGSDIVTSSGLPDEQDSEREYVKNTYTMTVISDDDSLPSPRGDDSGGISIQELKTLLAKREDEISDFQLKVSQDNIEIQELQFKLTEQTDKIQELENKLWVNQSELDEVNSLISDKDCKIDTLMKQKQALGEKCLRELEESENKHAKIVDEINEKFAKVMSDLKISQAEVSKLKLELEASQEQERMLEEQYDDLQQQQKAAMKNFQERSEHDNEEIINELKLEHQKEIELLKEKLKEEKSEHENEEIINEMKLEHQKELESLKEKHKDDLDSLSEKHIGDLEKLKEELENSYKEQIEELEYQHKLKIDSLTEDLEHENEVENETLKTELNVQMEVELKRQAADIAAQHEIEMKNLREEYEQKIQEIQSERVIEEKQQKSVSELVMSDIVEEKMEKTFSPREMTAKTTGKVQEEMVEEKLEKTFSPREDDSDTHSQDTVIEVSKSEDTVIDARNKSEAEIDKTEADGDSLEEDKDTKDNTLSESLLQTDQSQDFDQIDSSHDFDQTASSRDFTQTASTLDSATSSDSSEKELPPIPQGHDNTIAVLMQEIARAKEETVKQLQAEYHIEIADLNKQLDEAMEKNAKLEESYKEELEKLKESYESKIKEMEESIPVQEDSIPVQEDSVAELKQEYEGKLDQLNEKLKEAIDKNNELENTLKKEELDRLVEKYESRIKEMEELAAEKEETVKKLKDELEEEMAQLKEKLEETNESENSDKEELSKIKENYEARIKELEERDISSKEEAEELTLLKEKLEEATEKYSKLEENYKKEMEETVEKYEAKIKELEESNSTFKEEIEEINSLKQNLEEVTEKNSKLEEEFKEEKDKLIEQYEARIKELEESEATTKEEIEKQNLAKQKLIKEHDGEVSKLNREYEEKMDLLRQELMETFETEKEDLKKQHEADLNDAEEKYDTLIDRIKSGEAPEVADIIHERYDTELEMAKSLMQQEFDETLESEQARFMEQHQELMDKFIEERQAEAEELRMQHEKDIAECRKTIIEEYDAKIVELEQNQDLEIHRLKEEMAKIIPGIEAGDAAQEDKSIEEETEEQSLKIEQEVNQGNVELPSDPDIAKRRSSASKDDSIEDLRETHTAIIARIEAEYEEKLKKIKEEMASTHSTHSDDVDGASVDTIVSKKNGDQHKQELLSLEQHLSEKHKKEIQNLQTQHQNRIDDMENKYKQEIGNLKKILEFLQHSSSSEDTIHAQLASPAQTVPTLEGLEEEIVPEVSGRYVPSRSTPRDDMESVDRVEVTEKVKRPKQISPRDKKEIITEESSDESIKEEIDEESESEISEEPILPSSAPPRQLSASANFDFDAGLDVKPEFEEDEDLDRTVSYDKDDSFQSGRSTPPDLLQTRALGDTLAGLKTVSTYESGDLPVSYEVVKQKDAKIKELEEEVQKLTHRLQDQIEEERLILMRRERESQEGQNLELMLKSDLERVNDDRESVQRTNEQLLQLLSDSVKTYLNVEDSINKKLAKMVAEGDKSGGSKGKSSPKQERSQPVGAEGGEGDGESLQETSILSNVTDEGLDLSQRISESIFQGPELDKDGEELLKDASHRLQNSVSRLLEMIEETTNQLYEARTTQHELVDHVNIHEQDSNQMNSQVQELQEQLREEIRAKEYLAVELHKAEGLIEGYSSEREALNQQISELEEKKEALVLELETTKNKLQDLESVHHEAVSLRAELQRQQAIMQNNVGEEAQVTLTTAEGTPPRAEALLLELNRLNDEKRDLQQQVRDLQEKYEGRVRDLQCAGEETERHYLTILEEKKTEIVDLQLQVDATEKQLKANKQFLEEQAIEREQELEEYQREVNKWKQEAQNKNKMNKSENRLQKEVDDLTEELQDRMNSHSAIVQQTAKLQQDLREKKLTTEELNILVRQLELEIEDKNIIEKQLKLKIASLEEELEKQFSEDSGTESPALEEDVASSGEGSRQTRGHRRRRLLPSNVSVKQEEALIHEKEALQNQVEEQMKQISALKNQLDEMRQRGDYGEETQAASLQRKLEREKDLLEEKEQKVAELQVQIEDMEEQLSKKEQHIQQLTSQGKRVPVEEITSQYDDRVTQLERENLELVGKVKTLQDQSPSDLPSFSQTLLDEKNQEIDHLSDQVHQLQEELDKLNSGEDIVNLRDEVERLRGELDKRNFDFIRASHTSDGSFTDSEMPGVSASFAEKTSLQQEIEDSVANQIDQINGLQQEVEQLKSSLTQREDEITALKTELESKPTKTEDLGYLNDVLQEKEALIDQLNIQLEGLNHEVESLTDFQNKLQEDFDMVQAMLEEKEKEIDMLTHELTQKPSNDESVVKLELEIAKMSRDLAEKDNVIDEKAEEMYMLNEKLEQQEGTLLEMEELKMKVVELERETEKLSSIKSSEDETQKLLAEKEAQLDEKETEISQKEAEMSKMKEELDTVNEHLSIAENLQRKLEEAGMLGPNILLRDKDEEIQKLKNDLQELKQKLDTYAESDEQLLKNKDEIAKLKQELAALRIQVRDDRTEELRISHEEIGALRQRLKTADNQEGINILTEEINKLRKNMRPEDIATVIREKDEKLDALKCQSALLQHQLNMAYSKEEMEEKEDLIQSLQMELAVLKHSADQDMKTKEVEAEAGQMIQPQVVADNQQLMFAVNTQAPMRLVQEEEVTAELASDVQGVPQTAKAQLEARDLEIGRLREELAYFKDSYGSSSPGKDETISDLEANLEIKEDMLRSKEEVIEQLKLDLENVQQSFLEAKNEEESAMQAKSEEIQALQSQLVSFESKIDEYAHLKDRLDQYESDLSQKDDMLQDLEDECTELRKKLKDRENKMQQELQKAASFEAGDDLFAQLQEKQEKLEQTSKELSNTFSKLKETEGKLEQMGDVKQRLKEAVELSEQQLHIVEQKDQEFMKLKLEISELISEKDQVIKDLKQEVQQIAESKIKELNFLNQQAEQDKTDNLQVIEQLQYQVRQGGAGDAVSSVNKLQVQLQENENIMMEMHTELEATRAKLRDTAVQLESKVTELEEVRGQVSNDRVRTEAAAQGQLDQLRQELHIAKTALDEMQREGGWRNSRETSVDREPRKELFDSDDELEIMDRQELMKEIKELRRDLKTALSELDLFRSTVSMSAKDYVRKVMELREELSQQHQKHIQAMQDRTRTDAETNLAQLRIRYEDEIDHLKKLHRTEIEKKIGEVRREMEKAHNQEMERIMMAHQQEMEIARLQEPGLSDTMTMEAGRRLQSEISLSEKLDNRLLNSLQRQPEGASANDTTDVSGVSSTENIQDENMSAKLQMLMNRLHREGVQMLSISELQFLNRHMSPTQIDKEVDVESLRTSWESEKQSLLSAIQSLKDLLAQTHKLRGLEKGPDVSDWRGELLQAISFVFAKERDTLLAELRSHVLSHPAEDLSDIQKLEQKIRNQEEHQKSSLDQIFKADRQSMLAEIRDLRAHTNISLMKHQEEREKMSEQLSSIEDQTTKKERQAKRQVQLLEYKLQQEKILLDDIRSRYDMECERNSELSTLLSREKNGNLDYQTEISNQQVQISKLKEALEREQSRFVSVSGALDEEKGKSHYLSELLEAERIKFNNIQVQLDDIRVHTETQQRESIVEQLQKELMKEREKRLHADNTYELDQMTISTLKQELDKEQKNFHNMVTEYEGKLQQMATTIDMEKARCTDLEREIEREKYMNQRLRNNLEEERDTLHESTDREKGMLDEIQMELETEKEKNLDLQRSLDREKKRSNDLMKSVDDEKSGLREELDNERQACRQLKNELDQVQLQKLDITRHYEHERDQLNRVKVERDQLRNDMRALRERENERERQRDNDKITDKRTNRQLEREKDDFKMKLHEADLEMQRLKQKILDLEEQVTISREKEMDVIRELEQEKLRTLHNKSLERELLMGNEGSPRSEMETADQKENWKVYKAQLESLCQSLQYQMLQFQDKIGHLSRPEDEDAADIQNSVKDLLNELRHVQIPLTFETGADRNLMSRPDLNAVNGRVLHHNNELTNFVSRLTEEKIELRKALGKLEEEVWRYRQRETPVKNGDLNSSHLSDKHLEDKADWAKERLSLQLALNNSERQIEQLQHDLKIERDRRSTLPNSGVLSDYDKDKMQRLYGKYLRAESYRKALIYQKKYLLLLLGGFQDCEQTTLALIARMGAFPSPQDMQPRTSHTRLFTVFRSAARVVVAVCRMKFLVNKWKRAARVGSPVVSGTVDTQQGYMPTNKSYSPHARSSSSPYTSVNGLYHMSPHLSTASPRFRTTSSPHPTPLAQLQMYGSSAVSHDYDQHQPSPYTLNGRASPYSTANGSALGMNGTSLGMNGSSQEFRSSPSVQTSGARRKLISTPTSSPSVKRESPQTQRRVRISDNQTSVHDSYIQRLENLQMKLGSIDSGDEGDISSTEIYNLPEENLLGDSPNLSSISSDSSEYYPM